jgi:hypothetical protein
MQRLAALMPRPRLHLIRYHGVLAPNAKLGGAVIPAASAEGQRTGADAHTGPSGPDALGTAAEVRVRCRRGALRVRGQLEILAAIEEPVVIVGILTHLGLVARAPPRAAVREFSLDYAA